MPLDKEPVKANEVQAIKAEPVPPVGVSSPTEAELEAEILRLTTRSRQSGTKLQAKIAGLRTLLRIRQQERAAAERAEKEQSVEHGEPEWPSNAPRKRAPAVGYWPWWTQEEFAADPFAELCVVWDGDTFGARDRWREAVEGSPPWQAQTSGQQPSNGRRR